MGEIILAIEVGPHLQRPVLSEDSVESMIEAYISEEAQDWSASCSESEWRERYAELKSDVLSGNATRFEEFLAGSSKSVLQIYSELIESFANRIRMNNVRVVFYSPACEGWIHHSSWSKNYPLLIERGSFDRHHLLGLLVKLSQRDSSLPPHGLWDSLIGLANEQISSRVIVIGTTWNSQSFCQDAVESSRALLAMIDEASYYSLVLVGSGPETEEIQALQVFAAWGSGFLFPGVMDSFGIPEIGNCLVSNFLNLSLSELDSRRRASSGPRRISEMEPKYESCFMEFIRQSVPSFDTRRAIMEDNSAEEWRWTRGIRIFREVTRGLRDVVFMDPGILGLELALPCDGTSSLWTLRSTTPPVSGVGLDPGSILIAIDSHSITGRTDAWTIKRLLNRRPVCVTFAPTAGFTRPDKKLNFSLALAEELTSGILTRRAGRTSHAQALPPQFFPSQSRPWAPVCMEDVDAKLKSLVIACAVMRDLDMFKILRKTNGGLRRLLDVQERERRCLGYRILRHIIRYRDLDQVHADQRFIEYLVDGIKPRRSLSDMIMRSIYGISLADIVACSDVDEPFLTFVEVAGRGAMDFLTLTEAVTGACFTFDSKRTRQLRAEGVPFELLFASFVLRLGQSQHEDSVASDWIRSVFSVEGAVSTMWLRLFLARFASFKIHPGSDVLREVILHFQGDVSTRDILEAMTIAVNRKWVQAWYHLANEA